MKRKVFCIFLTIITLLSACGYSQDDLDAAHEKGYQSGCKDGYDEGYTVGYDEGFDAGYNAGHKDGFREGYSELKPVSKPLSGTILAGKEYSGSEITITADWGSSCVVSLKNKYGTNRVTFFVRAGETVTVGVPSEYLYVYFATGTTWYGYGEGKMFGDDTAYSRDDTLLDFVNYSYEYTLKPVYGGNFTDDPIDEDEFFG